MTAVLQLTYLAARKTLPVLVALHFLFCVGFVVPIHLLAHASIFGTGNFTLASDCCDHSGHDSGKCQICLSHGQVQTLVSERTAQVIWIPVEQLAATTPTPGAVLVVSETVPRAPPLA